MTGMRTRRQKAIADASTEVTPEPEAEEGSARTPDPPQSSRPGLATRRSTRRTQVRLRAALSPQTTSLVAEADSPEPTPQRRRRRTAAVASAIAAEARADSDGEQPMAEPKAEPRPVAESSRKRSSAVDSRPQSAEMKEPTTPDENENEESGDESESEEEEDDTPIVPLAKSRNRRANAGNRMQALIESTANISDEAFYATVSLFDKDDSEEFEQSDESADDDVDSDFDNDEGTEDEDEHVENEVNDLFNNSRGASRSKKRQHLKPYAAVPIERVDEETQERYMREALEYEKTAGSRVTDLLNEVLEISEPRRRVAKGQQFDAQKHGAITVRRDYSGVAMTFPADYEFKTFKPPQQSFKLVCACTGNRAKYVEPLTGLPYSDAESFRQIRNAYAAHLAEGKEAGTFFFVPQTPPE